MRQVIDNLDSFSGVAFGQVASLVLPVGPTYNAIGLEIGGCDEDQVEYIEMTLNGAQTVRAPGWFFRMKEDFKGMPQANNVWLIQFLYDELRTNEGQRLGEFVTTKDDKVVLKVRFGNKKAGQDVPTINGWTETTAAQQKRRFVPKILEDRIEIGATGLNNFRTFAKGGRIMGMHMHTGAVRQMEIFINDYLRYRNVPERNARFLSRAGFVPQDGFYHFVPTMTRFGALDALRTAVNKLEFKLDMTEPGDIDVIYEMIEAEGNPQADPFEMALAGAV